MQFEKANRLRDEWGDKPCSHPSTEKEYYLGADTGDRVCSQCGRVVDESEDDKNDKSKSEKKD